MIGNPCYQIISQEEYQMFFNNQNKNDEVVTKLLLMLPMVPSDKVDLVRLNHLALYRKDSLKPGSLGGRERDKNDKESRKAFASRLSSHLDNQKMSVNESGSYKEF
jgi:hypothetical protein